MNLQLLLVGSYFVLALFMIFLSTKLLNILSLKYTIEVIFERYNFVLELSYASVLYL